MAGRNAGVDDGRSGDGRQHRVFLIVLLVAAAIYLACIVSPPSLMDDVDAVQAQIARNMLTSGDWVTARLDGVAYLEKAPLVYWAMAVFLHVFGPFDWAARLPLALSSIGLALLAAAFGVWAWGRKVGLYAGLVMATATGLFLFTRILIPDVMLTVTTALSMWAFLRVIDDREPHPRLWASLFAVGIGLGLLLKSLIAVVFPVGAVLVYLAVTRQLLSREIWRRLHVFSGIAIILLVAAPWHVLATLRNPPYFAFDLHSGPGQYHGFFWFFFINEQLLRFLSLRYPRDYNTVPRLYFWAFHLLWMFPWSVYFPAAARKFFKKSETREHVFRPVDRAGRARLLALCWVGFVMVFFTFSSTQEYYSMPIYPALALLLGSAMADEEDAWLRHGTRVLCVLMAVAAVAALAILFAVRNVPAPGDISGALSQHPDAYTLSLGHMEDLTLASFAYLRLPLAMAAGAFLIGAAGTLRWKGKRAFLAIALMMVLFCQAARVALVTFDPYLGSRPLAETLKRSPAGTLIIDHHYYDFSSVFFYTNRTALLLNGRYQNLEYGAYAPGAPNVFIDDADFTRVWAEGQRYYVVALESEMPRFQKLAGARGTVVMLRSGGKVLFTNSPL